MSEKDAVRAAAELFKALSSPARLALLLHLERGPACVHELVEGLGASQSLVSQHLRILRGAQLVQGDRRGKEVVYTLMDAHISHLVADALTHVGEPAASEDVQAADPDQDQDQDQDQHNPLAHPASTGAQP